MSLLSPQLEAFMAICKHKTVHAAAQSIYMTQTAVTQRIQVLEAKLQTTLFIRSRRGMKLTAEGEALLQYCHAAKELEGEAYAKIQGSASSASTVEICISGSSSLIHSRIIPACYPVAKKFPSLLLHFDINDNENRQLALKAGTCQIAVVQPEHIALEMQSKTLEPELYVLVCSTAWIDRSVRDIIQHERIIDFNPSDQMTFNYLKQYKLFQHARHDRHFVNKPESLALMILEGFGYSALTREFAEPYIKQGQLMLLNKGLAYENPLSLIWFERPEPPAYFQALINAIA
ncbi:MAG: LysR family transcriptional regulator [Gammaproteobacteria bacterium]|nr:LysR family transcriptional regulator [Gammaproteobacteria bacterium]